MNILTCAIDEIPSLVTYYRIKERYIELFDFIYDSAKQRGTPLYISGTTHSWRQRTTSEEFRKLVRMGFILGMLWESWQWTYLSTLISEAIYTSSRDESGLIIVLSVLLIRPSMLNYEGLGYGKQWNQWSEVFEVSETWTTDDVRRDVLSLNIPRDQWCQKLCEMKFEQSRDMRDVIYVPVETGLLPEYINEEDKSPEQVDAITSIVLLRAETIRLAMLREHGQVP